MKQSTPMRDKLDPIELPQKSSARTRYNISRYALRYSRLVVAFWISVAVAGLFAFSSLKYALFPDIAFPVAIVTASAPTSTALETETQLTRPLESALRSLEVPNVFSTSYPGQAVINLAFSAGDNLENSTEAVKGAIAAVSLPKGANVQVIPLNLNESPAITYALESRDGSRSLDKLVEIARKQLIPALEKVPEIRQVNLLGDGLLAFGEEASANPMPTVVSLNGQPAIALQAIKRSDANTLAAVKGASEAVDRLAPSLKGIDITVAETQAEYIKKATQATIEELIGAIVLAVLVIMPFLRTWQGTLIAALTIPLSLLGTTIVMAIAGFNLETLTLLALALVIGIIVDDAIVDVENISRHIDEGKTPKEAAIEGTDEIGLTVTASTLTIVAVFLPIALMGGTLGQFFKPFGLTVAASVTISLLVARTLSPVLASYWLKPKKGRDRSLPNRPTTFFLAKPYRRLLDWSLDRRLLVLAIAVASFVAGLVLIPFIPQGFVPKLDRGEFNIIYTAPLPKLAGKFTENVPKPNADPSANTDGAFAWMDTVAKSPTRILLRRTQRVGEQLEAAVAAQPEVAEVFTIAGLRGEPNKGKLYVKLKRDRDLKTSEVQEQLRQRLPQLPGVKVSIEDILFVETGDDAPLKIVFESDDLKALSQTIASIKERVAAIPGIVDVKTSDSGQLADTIEHYNGRRSVQLSANLAPDLAIGDATEKVIQAIQPQLPAGITFNLLGDSARSGQVFQEFGVTLALAIVCMAIVLFLPFGRWLEPIAVLLSLPLSIAGALFALLVTQSDFGMISLIGLIFLLGLLDKNAILLMDYTNQLRQKGLSRRDAILATGAVRLRPIVMTTASTILGMLPIALGWGAGAELRQPMAVAIIGGLLTSTLLSLFVIPVLYTLLEDYGGYWMTKKWKS